MQVTRCEIDDETKLRMEGFRCGPSAREQARMQKRMEARAEQLRQQGEEMVARIHFRKKRMDPKRFRRARRSR